MKMDDHLLETLAEAAHDIWMAGKLRDGWRQGNEIDKEAKVHTCLVPYAQLTENDKESDRDMVRGIPAILAKAGYKVVKEDHVDE